MSIDDKSQTIIKENFQPKSDVENLFRLHEQNGVTEIDTEKSVSKKN